MVIGFPGYPFVYMRYLRTIFHIRCDDAYTMVTARVKLIPFEVPVRLTVDRIIICYRTPAAGNIRAGIYKDNGNTPQGGALLVESASVAKAGAWQKQEIVISDTELEPGLWWAAIQSDENTTVIEGEAAEYFKGGSLQCMYYDLGAYGPFTNPCPAVAVAPSRQPVVLLRVKSVYQPLT